MSASNATTRNKHFDNSNGGGGYSSSTAAPSIDITKDELTRISEALKKEEFRKLFLDYCEEIQDPENRKLYEEEIIQLEAERGVEVRFINPEPGFVIKTSADGVLKCFINVAKSPEIAKPTNEVNVNHESGKRGISWALPMAQAPPREDLDAHNKRCRVYDVVFHPDALHLAQRNNEFRKCLIDTALDAVEREYKVKLDRANLKFPKLDYKGIARPTVIRKLAKNQPAEANEPHPLDNIYPAKPTSESCEPKTIPMKTHVPPKPEYTTPKYVIKHRRGIDLTEYTEELDAKLNVTLPRELVVEVELPLLPSAGECQLDVTERSVYLLSERSGAKYRLKLELPHIVNDKEGAARFDTDTRRLSITLPVVQPSTERQRDMHDTLLHFHREDSGVESDMREESTSDSSSPSETPVQEVEEKYDEQQKDQDEEGRDKDRDTDLPSIASVPKLTSETFLRANIPYKLPEKFDCNVLDDVMSFVLHVRNVEPDSIIKLQLRQSVHIHFTSIGSGYYPTYYAFYIQLPEDCDYEINSSDAEAWENNVVLNLHLSGSSEQLQTYLAGIDANNVKTFNVRNQFKALMTNSPRFDKKSNLGTPSAMSPSAPNLEIAVARSENNENEETVEIEIKPREKILPINGAEQNETSNGIAAGGDASQASQKKLRRKQKKRNKKRRSLSESACDEIKNAIDQLNKEEEEAYEESSKKPQAKQSSGNEPSIAIRTASGAEQQPQQQQQQSRIKHRSFSECRENAALSADENSSPVPFKGILKHYSRYGQTRIRTMTSDSCSSSFEDFSSYSSSVDNGGCGVTAGVGGGSGAFSSMHFSKSLSDIPEKHSDSNGLSESCKKTVRFNDIIQKQIFRLDSSILGQRKKNQKCRVRKQRALQRRLSEGDSADYDKDHKPIALPKNAAGPPIKTKDKTIDSTSEAESSGDGNHIESKSNARKTVKDNESEQAGKPQQQQNNNKMTAKGKKKRQSSPRQLPCQDTSESSDVDSAKCGSMMFELDME